MTFADGVELDAVIGELLAQPGDIFGVTGEAVERLADDDVDFAILDRAQQPPQAWSVPAVARQLRVEPCSDHGAAETSHQRGT